MKKNKNDSFTLYDLRVEVVAGDRQMVCSHKKGDSFEVRGENIIFKKGVPFSLYALAALLPLLPAKQRMTGKNDWMTTDKYVACPDPHCGGLFKITRIGKRVFQHSKVSAVKLTK